MPNPPTDIASITAASRSNISKKQIHIENELNHKSDPT